MRENLIPVDKVRASRDGHEFHEAWTARRSLELLKPDSELKGIAVEGLSPTDQKTVSAKTVEIADITLYYGGLTFGDADRVTIAQFKYSIADEHVDFRGSDAKKTIEKFAETYREYKKQYGSNSVKAKLDFSLVTNRPIFRPLQQAIASIATGAAISIEAKGQADQLAIASGLSGKDLAQFAKKLTIVGVSGNLPALKADLGGLIVDWSATSDPIAWARLGKLAQMVRDKAGHAGTNRNLILRTDLLTALGIGDANDLLPCESVLPEIGKVVERNQLAGASHLIPNLSMPLLIHATAGVGKTVFMDSLAGVVGRNNEVVFFDCFGGGAYRSPEDVRHQPSKGLIHIANTLAFRGLCDPILPDATNVDSLLRTFRRRLDQCVSVLNRMSPGRMLVLFIDAIDNAELFAGERSEDAFPTRLMECLHHESIVGVKLIVSCRSERKPITHARYKELELQPFSDTETKSFLGARLKKVSAAEINVAQTRSRGNPRVLDYLVKGGRGLLDESEINKPLFLPDLIEKRIKESLATAIERGYSQNNVNAFLAGLAVLPPPIPLDEYAGALGMQFQEIESFAADLAPLLERTGQGLMFRDEPTETFIRNRYASDRVALSRVAKNLMSCQDKSIYAARALPGLLHILGDGDQLFKLAFDERIPAAITSTVGKRNIRYARIKAAVLHSAIKRENDQLVELLTELSTLAAVDQRGANYLLRNPDLVVAAKDVDAMRRLFETRTNWPATRHARLAIANTLLGELGEATRHANAAGEWIDHHYRNSEGDVFGVENPDSLDIAAILFLRICEGRSPKASKLLEGLGSWFSFEASSHIFGYLRLAKALTHVQPEMPSELIDCITGVGPLAAAVALCDLSASRGKKITIRLSKACKKAEPLQVGDPYRAAGTFRIQDGLRKAATLALSYRCPKEALAIARYIPHELPSLWQLRERWYYRDISPFFIRVALEAAASKKPVHEKDVLPKELVQICKPLKRTLTGKAFLGKVKQILPGFLRKEPQPVGTTSLSREEIQTAEMFLNQQLELMLKLTSVLSDFLSARGVSLDKAFVRVLTVWEEARTKYDSYRVGNFDIFFLNLGLEIALFGLWSRKELSIASASRFLDVANAQDIAVERSIQIISILALRPPLHELAGTQALKARKLIEAETDVAKRSTLFADLARAMLPASIDDASVYFRDGLAQMDAIGSDDSDFVNELLLFASTLKGGELSDRDGHTLSNISELNIGEEPHKFYWQAFAAGTSKAAGLRSLAKLCRWDDRSKVRLQNTLQPQLTALVEHGKIEPDLSLVLNGLASPVGYSVNGTKTFAEAIYKRAGTQGKVITELIEQFEDDNPGIPSVETLEALSSIAQLSLGSQSETTHYLKAAHKQFMIVRDTINRSRTYSRPISKRRGANIQAEDRKKRAALIAIESGTNPTDRSSLSKAIDALRNIENAWGLREDFLASLRAKVPFECRVQYIRDICEMENLSLYSKLEELTGCLSAWKSSSAVLSASLTTTALLLIREHAEDLVEAGSFSGFNFQQISNLTGVPSAELVIELIKVFARPEISISGSVWLSLASFVSPDADGGHCQSALKRLLGSDAARLANKVVDGPWEADLYTDSDPREVTCGMVWRMLGSPDTADRWRAAHSIQRLATFERWDVVDSLVKRFDSTTAGPYQARELPFCYLHAQLWMLIALARMALDHPKEVARYKDILLRISTEMSTPHVLMRHFANRALIVCINRGELSVSSEQENSVKAGDSSPHPRLDKEIRPGGGFYQGRPASAPEPVFDFQLDYDFHKGDVDNLSDVFGKPCWEVADMLSEIAHDLDARVTGMSCDGGRPSPNSNFRGMTKDYQTYGEQLGWHALFFAAGRLLRDCPVTNDRAYIEDPWSDWLGRYMNTREDGYWLSDGTDVTPLDATTTLLEYAKAGLVLTGDKSRLMQLAGLSPHVGEELIIQGRWQSPDAIDVAISSALVSPSQAPRLARSLTREKPMFVWIPTYEGNEEAHQYPGEKKNPYTRWIVCPSGEVQLDDQDTFGVRLANYRPFLAKEFASNLSLVQKDPFGRRWEGKKPALYLHSEAWGRKEGNGGEGAHPGLRLVCSKAALRDILKKHDKELLLLIKLQRYEKEFNKSSAKLTHTVAVVRIKQSLECELYRGAVNKAHESNY